MILKDVDYQINAVDELIQSTKILFNNQQDTSILIFKAPTGSGKTIMTAKYIQRVCTDFDDDICFVWVSVGKGGLHIQSKEKLEKIFQGTPEVVLLDEEFFGYRKVINKNEVVVVNWESINNKDKEGKFKNVLMRDGEKINFRQVLSNTREIGRNIILIIDESHYGASTERANEIKNEVKASIILEMSATPKFEANISKVRKGLEGYVEVDVEDVIKAQMIKKQLVVNEGLSNINERTIDRKLLELAYEKRLELKKLLREEQSNVNPLVIVQLPNAEEGKDKKETVIDFLEEKGINIKNGKLALWLDEEKENSDNISDNTNSVEFLLFKQAIDTGWDCPRAQILVKFRETQSTIFEKQTLGRILRMPEQKHYVDDTLNKAYVYTDYTGNILKVIDPEFDYPEENIRPIPISKKDDLENIVLYSENIHIIKKPLIKSLALKIFNLKIEELKLEKGNYNVNKRIFEKKNFEFNKQKLTENIIGEIEIESEKLLLDNEQFEGKENEILLDEERTEIIFRRILRKHSRALGNNRNLMFDILRECIYEFFLNYVIDFSKTEDFIVDMQKLFVLNYNYKGNNFFSKLLIDVINTYKNLKEEDLVDVNIYSNPTYTLPSKININTDTYELVETDKYFYNKCYLQKNRSKPEKDFEKFIMKHIDKIEFWWKNGDNGSEYFSIVYELKGEKHCFYPDYIIKFMDGRIGIFETKDDSDDTLKTTAKAKRLYQYIKTENEKGRNLLGGIVANYGTEDEIYIKINRKERYTTNNEDWEDLEEII